MMIQRLQVQNIRNLSRVSLPELSPINLFFGQNGSGKTSLLESIHLLLVGRSFRHHQFKPLLSEGHEECTVFGELVRPGSEVKLALGMQKSRDGKALVKLNGERLTSLAELVRLAPLQVLNADAFDLLTGGPGQRREFMDWGLFHVEQSFFPAWKQAQRALKHRNSLIRHGKIDRSQLQLWSQEYARYGLLLDELRRSYVEQLEPVFQQMLIALDADLGGPVEMSYHRGWGKEHDLETLLIEDIEKDLQQGFTRHGPHRADLRLVTKTGAAADILSRGQLKLVVASLRLSQAELLQGQTGEKCLFLVDDLPAELDRRHRQRLCRILERLESQVLVTCIEPDDLKDCWSQPDLLRMFHVEHGNINAQLNTL